MLLAATTMKQVHLSFSSCGFLGIYHLGAATVLSKRGRGLLCNVTGFAGASAGALVATLLLTAPERIEACTRFTFAFAEEVRMQALGPLTPGYDFMARLRGGIDEILPQHAHELARERLHVSVTSAVDGQNYLVSNFTCRDNLITLCVDGGLTNSLPVLPTGRTVTFSPFSGRADVSPRDLGWPGIYVRVAKQDVMVSMANLVRVQQALFPPSRGMMEAIYGMGMTDTVRFLRRERWSQ